MVFWRVLDSKLYSIYDTNELGFSSDDPRYIPDEYLENQTFVILRTAFGLGDQAIISAMPRLLKEKYPLCSIYLPNKTFLESLFGDLRHNWPSWDDPLDSVQLIFANNPYVNGFISDYQGDIFHDHYRIYDNNNTDVPLVEQMLKFWQFDEDKIKDSAPELYFTDEEIKFGNWVINNRIGNKEYCSLSISDRYDFKQNDLINDIIKDNEYYTLPWIYYTPTNDGHLDFKIDGVLNMKNITPRMQLYLRSKAKANVGNQSGVIDAVARYSKVHTIQRQYPIGGNYVRTEKYY